MDIKQMQETIEAMATEVNKIDMAYVEETRFGHTHIKEGAAYPEAEVRRVTPREYGLAGYVDDIDEHSLCVEIARQVIADMPTVRSQLFWRVYPEYEINEDFMTGRKRHKVYCRLGWMKEWPKRS